MSQKEVEITEEALKTGDLYRIAFPLTEPAYVYQGEQAKDISDILSSGNVVVHPNFKDEVGKTLQHEVVSGKTIIERRSAHTVGFGRFLGSRPDKPSGMGNLLNVALKPFNTPEGAANEFVGYQDLHNIGVETYQPVGVFPAQDNGHYILVSKKKTGLISLDRDDWVPGRQPTSPEEVEIAERNARTIVDISELLAWINVHGIYLPDGQIKNYAVTEHGRVGAIDLENITYRPLMDTDTGELAWRDIEKLVKSLMTVGSEGKIFGVGMFAHMSPEMLRNSCEQLIIIPYIDSLTLASEHPELTQQANELMYGITERFYKNEGWPMHLVQEHSKQLQN